MRDLIIKIYNKIYPIWRKIFKKKKKVFVAIAPLGKTREAVLSLQQEVINRYLGGNSECILLNPCKENNGIEYRALNLTRLYEADLVVLDPEWVFSLGCNIVYKIAKGYDIKCQALPLNWLYPDHNDLLDLIEK